MSKPRPLTPRALHLIERYSQCELGMTPRQFYTKWDVSYELIAAICDRSPVTVQRWFTKGRNYRRPTSIDLRHLAIADFILDHYDEIPKNLRDVLCPSESETED